MRLSNHVQTQTRFSAIPAAMGAAFLFLAGQPGSVRADDLAGASAPEMLPRVPSEAPSDSAAAPEARTAPGARHELLVSGGASSFGTGAGLGYRYRTDAGTELGVELRGSSGAWWIGGYEASSARALQGELTATMPLVERGPLSFKLHVRGGARVISDTSTAMLPADSSTALGGEITPTVEIRTSDAVTLRSGIRMPVWVATAPAVELDLLGSPILAGADIEISERISLTAEVETGSYFGYDGNGPKFILAGTVGARVALDGDGGTGRQARSLAEQAETAQPGSGRFGAFVGTEWRALALASHLSHGPGFQVGATFFGGHLKLGLVGYGRPGPINAKTFEVMAADGQNYKGDSMLTLRSDGNYMGILVAPAFDMPGAEWLRVELPMSVGQSGFGFYLFGEDRQTPDGRLVSEWENQLLDGRDSSFALGAEVGVQLSAKLPRAAGIEPYLAARWAFTVGYDSYVTDDYGGPSLGLGMQLRL